MNLCTNAARAMKGGGGVLTVRLETVREGEDGCDGAGDFVVLSVSDTGEGIAPELLERIFDPFFTTGGERGGTGLGLSVVHGIVASLGGTIRVESSPGKGARFEVRLPVAEIVGAEDGNEGSKGGALAPGAGERILYAEDEPLQREYVEEALTRLGYRVETVPDGEEALRRVREEPGRYALLLSDLAMPRLRGNRLAAEARRVAPRLPVILCTGYQDGFTEEDAREAGAAALLVKPVPLAFLARTVRELLDRERTEG
jgi:CheY-like chemotaxis protein